MDTELVSIPGWDTVRCIGSGSSGKVYELRKKNEYGGDFHSALKVISVPATQQEYDEMQSSMSEYAMRAKLREQVEEISSEYRLLGMMKGHPNIVNCEDVMILPHENDAGWDIQIRMELLNSLPDHVHEHGMTVAEVIKLGTDLCSALELCRRNGVMHRDIKPQNIFVSPYGDYKLGDFGVAKAANLKNSADKVGTYSYMAPEVFKARGYSDSIDIYSLGMVLYWLLNERRGPFLPLPPDTPSSEQIADAQLRRYRGEKLPPPKNGSSQLKSVVLKACSYSSADRYSSPTEMKNALMLAAAGKLVQEQNDRSEQTVRETVKAPTEKTAVKQTAPVQPRPAPQPIKTYAPPPPQEPESKASAKGYAVVLILLVVAMLAAVLIYLGKTGDWFDSKPETSPEPTQTLEVTPTPTASTKVFSVVVSSPSVSIIEGKTAELKVSFIPELKDGEQSPELVWKSSDNSIVTVDGGTVSAVAAGSATVRVYIADRMEVYDECLVTVTAAEVTKLEIEQLPDKTEYTLGEELDLEGLIVRAYYNNDSAERITDIEKLEIDSEIKGIGLRTVKVSYGGQTAEFTVKVSLF